MPTYKEDRPSAWLMVLLVVLVGGLVGLFYVGPSSWSWRGLAAPIAAGIAFTGSFMGLGMVGRRVLQVVDSRLDWLARTTLGAFAGAIGGIAWYAVLSGDSFLLPCLLGAGMGGFAALVEA